MKVSTKNVSTCGCQCNACRDGHHCHNRPNCKV